MAPGLASLEYGCVNGVFHIHDFIWDNRSVHIGHIYSCLRQVLSYILFKMCLKGQQIYVRKQMSLTRSELPIQVR